MAKQKGLSRREFLKGTGVGVAAAATGASLIGAQPAAAQEPVVLNAQLAAQKWAFEIPPDPIPESDISATVEAEIIVVGSGIAGLVAALSAAQNGAQVVLITASSIPVYRGGSFHAPNSKYMRENGIEPYDVDKFYRRELSAAGYDVDQTKWWKFARHGEEAMNWLIDMMTAAGYETVLEAAANHDPDGLAEPMYQPAQAHGFIGEGIIRGGSGAQLVANTLAANAETAGVEFRYKVIAKQLVREDNNTGRVTAVIAQGEDGAYTKYVGSKAIILATGDFSTDNEMLAKYCPKALPMRNDAGDRGYDNLMKMGGVMPGDGHKMGLWIGAAWQKTFPCAIMTLGGGPAANLPYGSHRGLIVNKNGQRFGNEDILFAFTANSLLHEPDMTGYAIWGTNYAEDAAPWYNTREYRRDTPPMPPAEVIAGWEASVEAGAMVKGDTIEEVIEQLGLPLEATMATVNRYNELCAAGVDEDFFKRPEHLDGITQGPFYGGSWRPVLLTVLGGLRTDINMAVCDENDQPIPGLYNIGVMVGDYFGTMYTFRVEGNNLGANCLTFPYLLGRDLATGALG